MWIVVAFSFFSELQFKEKEIKKKKKAKPFSFFHPKRQFYKFKGATSVLLQAEDWFLEYYNPPKKKENFNLESRVLGLRFQVDLSHYQGKNQILSLTCQSSVAGKTKTQRINVYLSRMMTNQKFAQEQINNEGEIIASISVWRESINQCEPRSDESFFPPRRRQKEVGNFN